MNRSKHITNCPNCSSNKISYDIKSEKLKCEHCNHIFETKKVNKKIKEIDTLKGLIINEHTKTVPKLQKELFGIQCTKCGAIKYIKDKTKYTYCRICGNKEHEILSNNIEQPNYILPFLINIEEAYAKHKSALNQDYIYSDGEFLNNFRQENLIGVYVPYRIENDKYICAMYGDAYATYDISSGDNGTTYKTYEYRINRNVEINAKDIFYERVDEDILTREDMLENIISEVSPYDMKEKIEFKKEYLDEYIILKPNEEPITDKARAEKLANIAKYAVIDDVLKYDHGIVWDTIECNILKSETSYVYLPIWLYYKAKNVNGKREYYYVAINGRTNEIGMQIPLSKPFAMFSCYIQSAIVLAIPFLLFKFYFLIVEATTTTDVFSIGKFVGYIVFLIFFIAIAKLRFNLVKAKYEGENVINENDNLTEYTRKILHRGENKIRKRSSSWPQIQGRNDNIKQYR